MHRVLAFIARAKPLQKLLSGILSRRRSQTLPLRQSILRMCHFDHVVLFETNDCRFVLGPPAVLPESLSKANETLMPIATILEGNPIPPNWVSPVQGFVDV